MNREIKFRGKRIDNGEWIGGYLSNENEITFYVLADPTTGLMQPFSFEVYPESVGECTGLRDNSRKEIYEGDVFKPFTKGINFYKVVFENGAFAMYHNYGYYGLLSRFIEIAEKLKVDVEIIGNIYENPELLKESK